MTAVRLWPQIFWSLARSSYPTRLICFNRAPVCALVNSGRVFGSCRDAQRVEHGHFDAKEWPAQTQAGLLISASSDTRLSLTQKEYIFSACRMKYLSGVSCCSTKAIETTRSRDVVLHSPSFPDLPRFLVSSPTNAVSSASRLPKIKFGAFFNPIHLKSISASLSRVLSLVYA